MGRYPYLKRQDLSFYKLLLVYSYNQVFDYAYKVTDYN